MVPHPGCQCCIPSSLHGTETNAAFKLPPPVTPETACQLLSGAFRRSSVGVSLCGHLDRHVSLPHAMILFPILGREKPLTPAHS